jgi:hypothetical protein
MFFEEKFKSFSLNIHLLSKLQNYFQNQNLIRLMKQVLVKLQITLKMICILLPDQLLSG